MSLSSDLQNPFGPRESETFPHGMHSALASRTLPKPFFTGFQDSPTSNAFCPSTGKASPGLLQVALLSFAPCPKLPVMTCQFLPCPFSCGSKTVSFPLSYRWRRRRPLAIFYSLQGTLLILPGCMTQSEISLLPQFNLPATLTASLSL